MVFPTSVNFPAGRPRFFTPWGAMSLMLRCFSARKFSLFPLPSQHENEFFFRKRCCEGMFFENSPTFCRKFATPEPSLPPFSAHPVHPWVKHAAASHTRAHVRPHAHPPQSLFFFCLHPFTLPPHFSIDQLIRCEDFDEFVFTVSSRAPLFRPQLDEMDRKPLCSKKILPTSSPDGLI